MWMVNPKILCRQHLLGEHSEIHKHRHNFVKQHSIAKRIEMGQIEPASMEIRHNQLVIEMLNRGYNHQSPYDMPDISYLNNHQRYFKVNTDVALLDLLSRCEECNKRYKENMNE
jgi:hypothetical protein